MTNVRKLKKYAAPTIKISFTLVVTWFGINQILNPKNFRDYLPNFLLILHDASTFMLINGTAEIILGSVLLIGLFTRIYAPLLAPGYNNIRIRNPGLTITAITKFLNEPDKYSIDKRIKQEVKI